MHDQSVKPQRSDCDLSTSVHWIWVPWLAFPQAPLALQICLAGLVFAAAPINRQMHTGNKRRFIAGHRVGANPLTPVTFYSVFNKPGTLVAIGYIACGNKRFAALFCNQLQSA